MRHGETLIGGHFFGGPCDQATPKDVVTSPWDGRVVGTVAEASLNDGRTAIQTAHAAFGSWKSSSRLARQNLLRNVARLVRERSQEYAELLCEEIGKPIRWARAEVERLAITFDLAADLVSSYGIESMPLDTDPRGVGCSLTVERRPVGVVLAIVPYNWPFNLAAHKIAPALAVGNAVVIKPSRRAALSTLTLARCIHEAGCPPGVLNAVNVAGPEAQSLAEMNEVAMVSFTGSPEVGWGLKDALPRKRVSLELGADSAAVVCADADLDAVIPKLVNGAFGYAGQVCISVQRIFVQRSVWAEVLDRLVAATEACPYGDPRDENVVCGPMISADEADRVMEWIAEAEAAGARVLSGGHRVGPVVTPTLIENVPASVRLGCREVFGPVATIAPFDTTDEAWDRVNASSYGIHAGVFTHDLRTAREAFDRLEVGGVVVNDAPTLRFDAMPYGGVKQSGFGREGVRATMDEMTEPKALLTRWER